MSNFILKLVDTCDNSIVLASVNTEKTLDEVVEIYNRARDEWYKDVRANYSLFEHLEKRFRRNKISFALLKPDIELDF